MALAEYVAACTRVLDAMATDPLVMELMRRVVEERYGMSDERNIIKELCQLDEYADDGPVLAVMKQMVEKRFEITVARPRRLPLAVRRLQIPGPRLVPQATQAG